MLVLTLNQQGVPTSVDPLFNMPQISVYQGQKIGIIGGNGVGKSTLLKGLASQELVGHYPLEIPQVKYFEQEVRDTTSKSGGERTLARLQQIFKGRSELLLLDEPTNHLDCDKMDWLQSQLAQPKRTVIMISHDREFLNKVVDEIWEIANGELTCYKGNYDSYDQQKTEQRDRQSKLYQQQQKEKRKVAKELQQLENWSAAAHKQSTKQEFQKEFYRSKAKAMDKQRKSIATRLENKLAEEGVERVRDDQMIRLDFMIDSKKSGPVILADNLAKSFGEKELFKDLNFTIMAGDKVAITGENGAGKSTLIKGLLGQEELAGKLWLSPSASIGYLSQDVLDLPSDQTIASYLEALEVVSDRSDDVRLLFAQLGSARDQWQQDIATLSMGERLKVKLLEQMLRGKGILILDEPTNHLDLPSRHALEEVLKAYQGTLILVTHDAYFRRAVTDREIHLGKVKNIPEMKGKKAGENLALEFKRDQLLSQLSLMSPGDKGYQEREQEFQAILAKLKSNR